MADSERRDRGALESEVLAALSAAGRAMTPREVQATLGGSLAYTTVMTTLARLHEKGALSRGRDGRAFSYRLAGDPEAVAAALTARRMRKILDAGGDRTVALTRFVADLGHDDEMLLAQILQRLEDHDTPGGDG
jgi:predicted transcriptional regulator